MITNEKDDKNNILFSDFYSAFAPEAQSSFSIYHHIKNSGQILGWTKGLVLSQLVIFPGELESGFL